jgi:hypothetical protein
MTNSRPFVAIISVFFALLQSACNTGNSIGRNPQTTPSSVATQDAFQEYFLALDRWRNHHISDYELTVAVFSSMLPPPCSLKVILIVQDSELSDFRLIETPMPIELLNGKTIYNPECQDYESLGVEAQFKVVERLLMGQESVNWQVRFDPKYGYVADLSITTGGESMRHVQFYDFKAK